MLLTPSPAGVMPLYANVSWCTAVEVCMVNGCSCQMLYLHNQAQTRGCLM